MQSQLLRSITHGPFSNTQALRGDTKLLTQKIENISALISSLSAEVEDLGSLQVPQLTEEFDFYDEVRRFEISLINSAMRVSGGSQVKAAKLLKLKTTTLNNKIKVFKLATR